MRITMSAALPVLFDGTAQADRTPPALDPHGPHGFLVDETTLPQRIAMTAAYARSLVFVDHDGRASGHWGELMRQDEAAVMADILALDPQSLSQDFERDHEVASDAVPERLAPLALQVIDLVGRFDLWLKLLLPNPQASAQAVAHAIERLLPTLVHPATRLLEDFFADPWVGAAANRVAAGLHPQWQAARRASVPPAPRSRREQLRSLFFTLLGALGRVQARSRQELPQSLQSRRHDSAVALLLGFLQLHQTVQAHINRFSDRQIDFYYRECLGLAPHGARPDRVHLLLEREADAAAELVVPAGTRFVAGKDAADRPIEYASLEPLSVGTAQVRTLHTLRLERDPLVAPERLFGYVTRAKIFTMPAAPPGAAAQPGCALFGGVLRGRLPAGAQDAAIGLAVASPLLGLNEGERHIRLQLDFDLARLGSGPALLHEVLEAADAAAFGAALGRLFSRWLLDGTSALSGLQLRRIKRAARRFAASPAPVQHERDRPGAGDPLSLVRGRRLARRELMFDQLFNDLFRVELSTAQGWSGFADIVVTRPEGGSPARAGLVLALRLPVDAPPIVPCAADLHGARWPALPVLKVLVDPRARIFPLSLLEHVRLDGLSLRVHVEGLRQFSVHNQLGRLDPSKPFAPFGPLPDTASQLVLGAPELANKPVKSLAFHVRWSGLPPGTGGFPQHYAGYPGSWDHEVFSGELALLRDGQWLLPPPAERTVPMFDIDPDTRTLRDEQVIRFDAATLATFWRDAGDYAEYDQGARNGHLRLRLAGPSAAFGHAAYPMLLTEVVSANAKRRHRRPLPMPNPPYLPTVERLTIEYVAESRLRLSGARASEPSDTLRVLHLYPFGIQEVRPSGADGASSVLPHFDRDGQLLIGLDADRLEGPLTLLFELREEAAVEFLARREPRPRIDWFALSKDGEWDRLPPERVIADATQGFLASGIVTLDLPEGIRRDHQRMPGGLCWLRASTQASSDHFAGLVAVHAQAVCAQRVTSPDDGRAPAPGRELLPARQLPGLRSVRAGVAAGGWRAAEDEQAFRTRAGERLRHKNRAALAWDYERLVLERFPHVHKVKCLDPASAGAGSAGPVLVVVVPRGPRNDPARAAEAARLNAGQLREIEDYLRPLASPLARIAVRNASWERVQVRCSVRLARGAQPGRALQRLQCRLVEYLSPWFDGGHEARFGWTLRGEDVEAMLRDLDEVAGVSGLSLLHFGHDDEGPGDGYWLADTARAAGGAAHLQWRRPWSLLLPCDRHLIDLSADEPEHDDPLPSGVKQFALGSTFIISAGTRGIGPP